MVGVITEKNWKEIDQNFPGIKILYQHLPKKPHTFLELLELFELYQSVTSRGEHSQCSNLDYINNLAPPMAGH